MAFIDEHISIPISRYKPHSADFHYYQAGVEYWDCDNPYSLKERHIIDHMQRPAREDEVQRSKEITLEICLWSCYMHHEKVTDDVEEWGGIQKKQECPKRFKIWKPIPGCDPRWRDCKSNFVSRTNIGRKQGLHERFARASRSVDEEETSSIGIDRRGDWIDNLSLLDICLIVKLLPSKGGQSGRTSSRLLDAMDRHRIYSYKTERSAAAGRRDPMRGQSSPEYEWCTPPARTTSNDLS